MKKIILSLILISSLSVVHAVEMDPETRSHMARILGELAYTVPCAERDAQIAIQKVGTSGFTDSQRDQICWFAGRAELLAKRSKYLIGVYGQNKPSATLGRLTDFDHALTDIRDFCATGSHSIDRGSNDIVLRGLRPVKAAFEQLDAALKTEIKDEEFHFAVSCY